MVLFVIDHLDKNADVAFAENLYNEYLPFLKQRVYKYIPDMEVCNDLAHDCMVNMFRHLDKIKTLPEDKVRAYISVSINNLITNYFKRTSKQAKSKICDLSDNYDLVDDYSLEEEIEQKCDYETIKASFDKLCERDKSIITMKYDLELNDSQISDVLQIKPDSVRMTVLRSVRRLKKQMKKSGETV